MLAISTYNRQDDLAIDEKSVKEAVASLLYFHNISCNEIHIHLVEEKEIIDLHREYFNDPTPTDCITFPIDELDKNSCDIIGEIFLCPKVAISYSLKHNLDPYEELSLYLSHGILHLLGYNDIELVDQEKMRQAESDCMKILKSQNLILKNTQFAIGKA